MQARRMKRFLWLLLALALSGCASLPDGFKMYPEVLSLAPRTDQLNKLRQTMGATLERHEPVNFKW